MIEVEAPAGAIDVCGTGGDGAHSAQRLDRGRDRGRGRRACRSPSTAIARHRPRPAPRTRWRRSGSIIDRGIGTRRGEPGRSRHRLPVRAGAPPRARPARTDPPRDRAADDLQPDGPLVQSGAGDAAIAGRRARRLSRRRWRRRWSMLGTEAGLVVSGEESLDELSIAGPSRTVPVGLCAMSGLITPEDAGLARHGLDAIRGGDAAYNAAALRALLQGAPGAYRDAVLLNAGAAFDSGGRGDGLARGCRGGRRDDRQGPRQCAAQLLDCLLMMRSLPLRHAGLVPASTHPRAYRLRPSGPRNKSGVTKKT